MCTVVIDAEPGAARLLAVRDEDPLREWDDLGAWWPQEYPGVIGIRDRRAGGAWLAYDPEARRLAVLLNRADVLALDEDRVRSRGSLALESVAGRPPVAPLPMHGFNLIEVAPEGSRVLSWDGEELRETPIAPGVHMIAHDDLDDRRTPRLEAWLPRFRAAADTEEDAGGLIAQWVALLAETAALPPEDDRAIIRDNRPHGYPTQSLLYCTATIDHGGVTIDEVVLDHPAHLPEGR